MPTVSRTSTVPASLQDFDVPIFVIGLLVIRTPTPCRASNGACFRCRASGAYLTVGLSDSACFRCRASSAYLAVGLSELSRSMPTRGKVSKGKGRWSLVKQSSVCSPGLTGCR